MMDMHMSFWFGSSVEPFLFDGYDVTSSVGLLFTCLALVSLGILFEGVRLKVQRLAVKQRSELQPNLHGEVCPNECDPLLRDKKGTAKNRQRQLGLQVMWYTVQTVLSYVLMLAVMTYNGYLALSVVAGAGLGYLVFGPAFMEVELCNFRRERDCPVCRAQVEKANRLEEASPLVTEVAEGLINSISEESVEHDNGTRRPIVQVHCPQS